MSPAGSTPIRVALVGAGNRGRFVYAGYARRHPERMQVVALAEPVEQRRRDTAAELGLDAAACHPDAATLLAARPAADAVIVASGDTEHVEPALAALADGYHVLLEKPIAPEPADCIRVVEVARKAGRILQIGHVLRYTSFYTRAHEIARSGVLGDPIALDLREHVAHWHMTHSYVRGKFRKRALAAPLILAKSCHDLDLMAWFADRRPLRLSSFGSLAHYRAEQAPPGATERCSDGCPVRDACPHDAERFYLGADEKLARHWPWSDVSPDPSREARQEALRRGPYGRCVYRCDNDVVDHQTLSVEFEGGLLATLGVHGHASREVRTLRLTGTRGELRGTMDPGVLEVHRHGQLEVERIEVPRSAVGHYGGDEGLLDHFCDVVARDAPEEVRASGEVALVSHLLGFAAETSRLDGGRVIDFPAWSAGLAG